MKKHLIILLTIFVALSLFACYGINHYDSYATPENGIFYAPDVFYLDWDIPSVRDISVSQEGQYSMPVYKFETYDELLHLKDIVGMDLIGNESQNTDYCSECSTSLPCAHDLYNEEFFEHYTLLIGWHQYAGVIIAEHSDESFNQEDSNEVTNESDGEIDNEVENETPDSSPNEIENNTESTTTDSVSVAKYVIGHDGSLVVYLQGKKSDSNATQQWVLVAVPKSVMADCDSIVFFVELPNE